MRKSIIRFIPALLWMCFIFFLSSQQTSGIPIQGASRILLLKSFHLIEYAVLTVFLNFGKYDLKKNFVRAYLYSLTDEFHQTFVPGREGKFVDTLIDSVGISIGTLISFVIFKKSVSIN